MSAEANNPHAGSDWWRDKIGPYRDKGIELLDKIPWVTPNKLTIGGTIFIVGGIIKAAQTNRPEVKNKTPGRVQAAVPTVVGTLADIADGAFAAFKLARDPSYPHDPELGDLLDSSSDRLQEFLHALAHLYAAIQRKDTFGEYMAIFEAVCNPLTSFLRAVAEAKGRKVPKEGKGKLGILGARPGRAGLQIGVTVIPEIKEFPIQPYVSALSGILTLTTAVPRAQVILADESQVKEHVDEKTQKKAKSRQWIMGGVAVLTPIAIFGARKLFHDWENKKLERRSNAVR